jgi:hypothetical protein
MTRFLPVLFILVISCTCYPVYSQSSCAQTLRLAQSIYEQGRLHELESTLDDCLNGNKFSEQEKVSAYKLLVLTYIYLEEPEKADGFMLKILQTDHEFKVNESADPAEFVALYKTFRTTPIYRAGGKLGAIASQPHVISSESVVDGVSEYKYRFGLQGSLAAEVPIHEKLVLSGELAFQVRSFKNTITVVPNDTSTFTTTGLETGAWLVVPIQMQYEFYKRKNTYYAAAGASLDYLLASSLKVNRLRGEFSIVDEKDFDVMDQRNKLNYSLLISTGLKRKIGPGLAVVEMRYQIGLRKGLTKQDVFENEELIYEYHYADAIFSPRALAVSIGYLMNIYHPKKLSIKKK